MELLDNQAERNKQVNFKREVGRYLKKWPWVLLSVVLFYFGSRVYLRYIQPQYLTKTSLMLSQTRGNSNAALSDMKNLGMGVSGDDELQGETTLIVSKPILGQVVKNLNLQVSLYSIGKILEVELYKKSPLKANILKFNNEEQFGGAMIVIKSLGNHQYRIIDGNSIGKEGRFGQPLDLAFGTVQISEQFGNNFEGEMKIVFQSLAQTVAGLEGSIVVSLPENKGMLMELSMTGPVPEKSADILNEITKQYNADGIKDKNLEAQNTKNFINGRLDVITADLDGIEGNMESFKRKNQITDLESQASNALSQATDNTKVLLSLETQMELVNLIYAATAKEQLLPTNMGLGSTDSQISAYNELLLTRNRVLKQATPQNPAILQMNRDIEQARLAIRKNLNEQRENLNLQAATSRGQLQLNKGIIDRYPTQEKVFRNIQRQQNLKEQLYLYLLQKREENEITLAVTAPKSKVVNPAYTIGQVKPDKKKITSGALAIGFLLPLAILFVINTIDTKVHTKLQIQALVPNAAVLTEVPVNNEENAIVHPKDFSVFAESFRILASNLKYMLKETASNQGKVVLVTSSIKGEGKTTVAMNLAVTLAWRSKVLILGADIRNPQLHRFTQKKNIGLTDYLISDDNDPTPYIVKTDLNQNLDALFSGAIAPNPNDLLDMQKFDDMIQQLKKVYDYIIIDSAPVMLVSDTLNIIKHSDVVLYTIKSSFTEKEMLGFATEFRQSNNIKRMAFVLNAVEPRNTRYGSKYGYGYYSYHHVEQKKGLKKYFNR